MNCQRCGSERILRAGCKCSDRFVCNIGMLDHDGYVPNDLGIGGGDYVEFDLCLDCGQLQGNFPLPQTEMEKDINDDELTDFFNEFFKEGEVFSDIHSHHRVAVIKAAGELSANLSAYISDVFEFHCDIDCDSKVPDTTTFISMYRDNKFEL